MDNNGIKNNSHSLWDSFEHILLFSSLYIFIVLFSLTLHAYVDHWLPNPLLDATLTNSLNTLNVTLLRYYISGLIVSYPVFAFLFLKISKRTLDFPEVHQLKSRKMLTYLTLIITFLMLIFGVISLIFSFLSGNTSVNFLLHFAVTIIINGLVFGYYLYQNKDDRKVYV